MSIKHAILQYPILRQDHTPENTSRGYPQHFLRRSIHDSVFFNETREHFFMDSILTTSQIAWVIDIWISTSLQPQATGRILEGVFFRGRPVTPGVWSGCQDRSFWERDSAHQMASMVASSSGNRSWSDLWNHQPVEQETGALGTWKPCCWVSNVIWMVTKPRKYCAVEFPVLMSVVGTESGTVLGMTGQDDPRGETCPLQKRSGGWENGLQQSST